MKIKPYKKSGFSYLGALIFFVVIAVVIQTAVITYDYIIQRTDDVFLIALLLFIVIFILSAICTAIDVLRRKYMIDKPVSKILSATDRISHGDFESRVEIMHTFDKYTEFDLIAENLNAMAEELSKSELLKTDFISNVSHELKTPLAVIKSYTKSLSDPELDSDTREKYIETITAATDRLSGLVTNILLLNKLENQHIRPEMSEFDLGELVAEAVLDFEGIIEDKNISLECEIDSFIVYSSPDFLKIVFNNLISNALKFTECAGKIGIRVFETDAGTAVAVSDTGCGIEPHVGEHIFEKFYQGDTSHSSEGNGLGLSLVKKVIDILGGEITVHSEKGKGTTFTVIIR